MDHLTLSFFGAFQATLGDRPLTAFRSAKVQGILVYLVLTQQPQTREGLAALFWPDEPEAVAKQNLRQSIFRLRQVLGDADVQPATYLLVTRLTVQFNPASDHALDVAAFLSDLNRAQLEPAVTWYRGELLPGFTCDSLPFDEWLQQERERLHRLALGALFELADYSLARADYPKAQSLARQQLAWEPWREEAHRQLMQALALSGERSAALAQYETCRAVLQAELGIEPTAETEALAARIRVQQPEHQAHALAQRRLTVPFVGRNREVEALVNAYQRAGRDGVQVVTLVGEAGIGKTRLAQQFLDWAATQGADVLRSRAFETGEGLAYQPLTHLLRPRLERENAPDDLLSDLWLTQLTRILPELRDRYPDLSEPTQEEATARQHLFEAITRLGQALAQRAPLVLFLDDWHWADAASLDALHYAALRWSEEGAPILVLLTLRQETLTESPDLQRWLTYLKHAVAWVQLHVTKLSKAETEHLIRALLEPEEGDTHAPPPGVETQSLLTRFSHWLFAETAGHPLFLVEMLKTLVEDGLLRPAPASALWHVDGSKFDEQVVRSRGAALLGVREISRGWLGYNLPLQLTSFIGREKEIADINGLLDSARLVSLTGSGGTGKTRLSQEVGAQLLMEFPHGVWFIELAPLSDAAQIMPALARVFGLQEVPFNPLADRVLDYLRDKELLLILDNCEHLIEACARLADDLLHQCAGLKILASSREALGIAGEMVYRIPPLMDSESTQLFVERARAVHSNFKLTDANVASIAQICRCLDNIPLALELAAARVKLLTPEQLASRLDDRFRLLIGGSRTALPRHQTLRALLDWSYNCTFADLR